ncbi:MAG: acyl-CoA dehydrogenase family protein, partial [Deltaproteobacteria bacterium]|nr:acyl-CoA dehydrogenase family protein [Deltaproteobacteria bacterium]
FILERGDLGLTVGQPENKMGIRASKTASVFFENVRVPGDRLLGEEGKGFKIAMTILNNGRTGLAGGSVGGMRRMYEMALSHASTRVQFGKKLIEFDIIKEKLLRMRAFIYAVQSMQEVVSWLIDSGGDCALEAAVLKVFSTDALWEVSNEALQIAGGNGYMKDYEYERFVRDARINRIFEGSNEILRLFISLNGFKALSEKFANLRSVSKFYEDPIKGFGLLVDYLRGPRIKFEYDMLSELSSMILFYQNIQKKIFKTFCKVAFREGGNIVGKQMISLRVSEIVIWLFSVCCSMARYFKEENKGNLPILEYLSHIATSNIELNLKFLEKDETSLIRKWFN